MASSGTGRSRTREGPLRRQRCPKYANALRGSDRLEFAESSKELSTRGDRSGDHRVHAEGHEWVILTGDKRFLIDDEDETSSGDRLEADCGVIYYGQDHDPSAGEVVEALETIAENAENCRAIETYVP